MLSLKETEGAWSSGRGLGWELAVMVPTEVARAERVVDLQLHWRRQRLHSLITLLQQPGVNVPQFLGTPEHPVGDADDRRPISTTPAIWWTQHWFDERELQDTVIEREVVIREVLLAMAMLEWKRVHGTMPDYLSDLAPYCVIENNNESDRVLPVMALNDPWTGGLFEYSGLWLRNIESRADQTVGIICSAGPRPSRTAARSVNAIHPHRIDHVGGSTGDSMIRSDEGRLSLYLAPYPRADR
jgi:hypothetical protein